MMKRMIAGVIAAALMAGQAWAFPPSQTGGSTVDSVARSVAAGAVQAASPLAKFGTSLYPIVAGSTSHYDVSATVQTNTIGAKNALYGAAALDGVQWVNTIQPGIDSVGAVTSYTIAWNGLYGSVSAVRTSDITKTSHQNSIADNVVEYADDTSSYNHSAWARYEHCVKASNSTAYGFICDENSTINLGPVVDEDPFNVNAQGSTHGVRVDSGLGFTSGSVTGSISGTTLSVTAVNGSAYLMPGEGLTDVGPVLTAGTVIVKQLTGTQGGVGTYQVNTSQTVASETISYVVNPLSSLIELVYNGGTARRGILVQNGSLDTSTNANPEAVSLPCSYSAYLYYLGAASKGPGMYADCSGVTHWTYNGSEVATLSTTGALVLNPSSSGVASLQIGVSTGGVSFNGWGSNRLMMGYAGAENGGNGAGFINGGTNKAFELFVGGSSGTPLSGNVALEADNSSGLLREPSQTGISAAGTTLATATALTKNINVVGTVSSGSGVVLASFVAIQAVTAGTAQGTVAAMQDVFNASSNALLVYPPSASANIINGTTAGAAGAAVSLAVGAHARFACVNATQCFQAP